jgi:predicted RNA polymerase sigma factor
MAQDLAAEALTRTYDHWRKLRSLEYRDAWVLRVVTNLAIDSYAKRRVPFAHAVPLGIEDAAVLRITLAQALRALPARQRDAVVLRYLVDLSEADTAEALGIAQGPSNRISIERCNISVARSAQRHVGAIGRDENDARYGTPHGRELSPDGSGL